MVERGVDPALEKREAKRRVPDTVRAVGEQFIERYCRPRNRTADEIARMLEIHLYPALGEKPIEAVSRRDILRLLDRAEERGVTVRVNRILSNVRRMFAWAVEREIIETSPVANVKAPVKEIPRDRVLSDDELRAFLSACTRMGEPFGPLFRLLLLTAQRRNEIAAGRWEEVDLTEATWSLPAVRVKNGRADVFPLSDQSLDIIAILESMGGSEFLFPARYTRRSTVGPRPVSGFGRAKERLDVLMLDELRKLAEERGDDPEAVGLEPWRLHDLRRTAASGMARLGEPIHVVEKLLNHVSGSISGVAAVYNRHSYQDEMRAAAQSWADAVSGISGEVYLLETKQTAGGKNA